MLTRTGAATWLLSVVVLLLRAPDAAQTLSHVGSPSFPTALLALVELVLLPVAAWTAATLGLCALGGSVAVVAARLLPVALRGLLVAGVAGTLTATAAQAEPDRHERGTVSSLLDGLVLPERPVADARSGPSGAPPAVRVAPGDTLWAIAARHLDADASPAEVARATLQWHEANRAVVGDDPDLVQPGQRLVAPRGLR